MTVAVAQRTVDDLLYDGEGDRQLYTGGQGLMGTWEVARYLGVEKSRIARWLTDVDRGKKSISKPVARLKSGPFWTLKQIERKAAQMYEVAHGVPPASDDELERWLVERRSRRTAA